MPAINPLAVKEPGEPLRTATGAASIGASAGFGAPPDCRTVQLCDFALNVLRPKAWQRLVGNQLLVRTAEGADRRAVPVTSIAMKSGKDAFIASRGAGAEPAPSGFSENTAANIISAPVIGRRMPERMPAAPGLAGRQPTPLPDRRQTTGFTGHYHGIPECLRTAISPKPQ